MERDYKGRVLKDREEEEKEKPQQTTRKAEQRKAFLSENAQAPTK